VRELEPLKCMNREVECYCFTNLLEEMSMQQFYPLYQQQLDPTNVDVIFSLDKSHASERNS
jgi:hypothetical protein